MDEVNETTYTGSFKIEDNTTFNNDITLNGPPNTLRTFWGTKNRSIGFEDTDTVGLVNNPPDLRLKCKRSIYFLLLGTRRKANHNMDIHAGDFNVSILNNNISLMYPEYWKRYSYQTPQTFQDNGFIYFLGIRNKMRIFS